MTAAGCQAVAWEHSGDRPAWLAGGPGGTMLAVSRLAAGGWQAAVGRPGAARTAAGDRSPVLARRLAAQRSAERRAGR